MPIMILLFALAALVLLWLMPLVIQFFLNIKGRKVFNGAMCPACGTRYSRADVRSSKHLMKTKVLGGPPPAPFSAHVYEAWKLRCGGCGRVQEFDPAVNPIIFDQ